MLIARLKDSAQATFALSIPDATTSLLLNKDSIPGLYSNVVNGLSFNTSFQLSVAQVDVIKLEELVMVVKYGL
jgi:hypothetical protein